MHKYAYGMGMGLSDYGTLEFEIKLKYNEQKLCFFKFEFYGN
jgi:hypothetical protein